MVRSPPANASAAPKAGHAEALSGRTRRQAQALRDMVTAAFEGREPLLADVPDLLAIVEAVRVSPSRRRCALLPWVTLEAALAGRTQARI